jgi:uncharacterized protein
MKSRLLLFYLFSSALSIFMGGLLSGQTTLDHQVFLKEMENSSDNVYRKCIGQYEAYLSKAPTDVAVNIEMCKFILYAQYDDEEEYNPNQEAFDSCLKSLVTLFPDNPEVLIFQTTLEWGDDLKEVFRKAEEAINDHPEAWSKKNLSLLYAKMADQYYNDEDYKKAHEYIKKAIANDDYYLSSLEYAQILFKLKRNKDAISALTDGKDTIKDTWHLNQRADLLIELKAYPQAMEVYNQIDLIDSSYNNNQELSGALDAVGEHESARKYLIADTSKYWDKKTALRNLLIHDLKYEDGTKSLVTYNQYRDLGYSADPVGMYRLKLFISHPLQAFKFRDLTGIITFLLILILLFIIPSIWILPVYFLGHHWNFINENKPDKLLWGLKMYWFVSFGYLLANFIAYASVPETFYSLIDNLVNRSDLSIEKDALTTLIFIIVFGICGLAALYKVNLKILLSCNWSVKMSILMGIGILFAFKFIAGIYMIIGIKVFGISSEYLTTLPNLLLSVRQNIEPVLNTYGKGTGFLLIGLFVPLYEEVIFRGVILDSCQRYINFNTANIIQALLFSLGHMSLFLLPLYFVFGILTGIMRRRSGGLLPGIVFHAVNNSLAIFVLLLK